MTDRAEQIRGSAPEVSSVQEPARSGWWGSCKRPDPCHDRTAPAPSPCLIYPEVRLQPLPATSGTRPLTPVQPLGGSWLPASSNLGFGRAPAACWGTGLLAAGSCVPALHWGSESGPRSLLAGTWRGRGRPIPHCRPGSSCTCKGSRDPLRHPWTARRTRTTVKTCVTPWQWPSSQLSAARAKLGAGSTDWPAPLVLRCRTRSCPGTIWGSHCLQAPSPSPIACPQEMQMGEGGARATEPEPSCMGPLHSHSSPYPLQPGPMELGWG